MEVRIHMVKSYRYLECPFGFNTEFCQHFEIQIITTADTLSYIGFRMLVLSMVNDLKKKPYVWSKGHTLAEKASASHPFFY